MNMGDQISLQDPSFHLNIYPEVRLLGHMVVLFWSFCGIYICFPLWLHQITFPPVVHKCSLFSTFWPTLISYLLDDRHYNKCGWYLIMVLICISLWLMMLNTSSSTCWPFLCFFKHNVYLIHLSIFFKFIDLFILVISASRVGQGPMTLRSRVACSTNWAS